jgi:hypothetical protein
MVKPAIIGGSEVRLLEVPPPFIPQVLINVRLTAEMVAKIPRPPKVGTDDK